MTGQALFETYVLTLLAESSENAEMYEEFVLPAENITLSECFKVNNDLRKLKGKEPLESRTITALGDEIPYEEEVIIHVLPYGIALILVLDDDKSKASYFLQMYETAKARVLSDYCGAQWVDVEGGRL